MREVFDNEAYLEGPLLHNRKFGLGKKTLPSKCMSSPATWDRFFDSLYN